MPWSIQLTRPLCPWNSPGKNIRVGIYPLLQVIFLIQGSNPGLLHCSQIFQLLLFSCSVMSDSFWPRELQHFRFVCLLPSPRACSNSYSLSQWCHPTVSSSVSPFSSCLQNFPSSGSFPMSQFLASGGQSTGSFSISPSKEHPGLISFRMDWLDLLAVQGTLRSLLQHQSSKALILQYSAFFMVQLTLPYITTGKTIGLTRWTFVGKVMSLLFNMLSRLAIAFLPRSKCLLISRLQSSFAVILEPGKIKSVSGDILSPSICNEVIQPDAMIFIFWMFEF